MLTAALPDIFFRKNDPLDPRLGEFVNLSTHPKKHRFSVMAAPDDRGVVANSGRPGAIKAPDKIREQFYRLPLFKNPNYTLSDLGNLKLTESIEQDHKAYAMHICDELKEGATCLLLGGGNDYAYADALGVHFYNNDTSKLGLINIDAHLDVRDLRYGITSGTPFYRVLENIPPIIKPENFIEFACQGRVNSAYYVDYLKKKNVPMLWLEAIQPEGVAHAFQNALNQLSQKCSTIVVTLDMDAVAQAYAPGVSAPSPNGLSAKDVETISRISGANPRVRIFSIYEVNPEYDHDAQTSRLAASCMWNFLDARLI